ncbi:MAG: hypothetical protein XU15_C0018G0057 [candidate division NC10 bacterium CSP1-5]|nr:MAG: hypothetical protein XU15_C0018G0057 [candidate division NC10 bacterium CSP1-5]
MKLTSEEAFELSRRFRELSVELGNFRFSKWKELSPAQRRTTEDAEWSLLNASSDMITSAVGIVLDETETSFQKLQGSTNKAKRAIQTLKTVRKVINIATAAVGLAAAIISRDPGAIAKNAKGLFSAATEDDT